MTMKMNQLVGWLMILTTAACTSRATPTPSIIPTATQTTIEIPPTPAQVRPDPRAGHELIYDSALQMVLTINVNSDSQELGMPAKIWGWDGTEWKVAGLADGPMGRNLGGVAYDSKRNVIVVYGGWTPGKCYTDTWEWNGQVWSKLPVEGPGVCDHFLMVYDSRRGKVVLFGGQDLDLTLHGDTWEWDGSSWAKIAEESTLTPPKRAHYALGYDSERGKVLLFGGFSPTRGDLNDFWEWDGVVWNNIESADPPSARAGARMTFDEKRKVMILHGGSHNHTMLDETWIWNGKKWTLFSGEGPSARGYHALAYDPIRERVVLFGGQSSLGAELPLPGDTWEWDGKQWLLVDMP